MRVLGRLVCRPGRSTGRVRWPRRRRKWSSAKQTNIVTLRYTVVKRRGQDPMPWIGEKSRFETVQHRDLNVVFDTIENDFCSKRVIACHVRAEPVSNRFRFDPKCRSYYWAKSLRIGVNGKLEMFFFFFCLSKIHPMCINIWLRMIFTLVAILLFVLCFIETGVLRVP
jgi:hypothetical protein